jgi:AcrR family transcriptional regulator
VPRLVDHAARRQEIAEALWRVVRRDGVHEVSVRTVADEAGTSPGALRHYFASQDELLGFALRAVVDRAAARYAFVDRAAARCAFIARAAARYAFIAAPPLAAPSSAAPVWAACSDRSSPRVKGCPGSAETTRHSRAPPAPAHAPLTLRIPRGHRRHGSPP